MAFQSAFGLSRFFSTSCGLSQLVKAPIQVFGREGRYAHALYSAASKEKVLDKMEGDLKKFQDLVKEKPELKTFLDNPSVQRKEKTDVVEAIVGKLDISPLCKNMFKVMAENGALTKVDGVVSAFIKIMCAVRKEVVVVVTTAKKLSSSQEAKLNDALKKFLKEGEVIKMSHHIDPALMGGMTVSIGDKFVDMSTATKMKTYTQLIKQNV